VWCLQLELPAPDGEARRPFRRSGLATSDAAQNIIDDVRALLALAAKDHDLTLRIAELLHDLPTKQPIPSAQAVAKKLRAGHINGVTTTVSAYLDDWLAGRQGLSPGTTKFYRDNIDNHLKPNLGHLNIDELKPVQILDMFTAIDANNARITDARTSPDPTVRATVRGVRTVGDATKHRIRATLRKALTDAIKIYHLIDYNPAVPIDLPSGDRPRARAWTAKAVANWKATREKPSPVMVWLPEQARAFLDYAEAHDIICYALYSLVTVWGLRRAELCGLRDRDVDLDAGTITIVQQRTAVGYKPIVRKVKSKAGDRILAIDKHTAAIIRAYLAMRARWQLASGPEWPNTGFLFVRPNGEPWHPDQLSDRFEHTIRDSGLPPIRFHDLRHCAASYLKLGGADMKKIQEVLGHSSIVITSDNYTLLFGDLDRTATDNAANVIHKNRRGKKAA
jgi:integrase